MAEAESNQHPAAKVHEESQYAGPPLLLDAPQVRGQPELVPQHDGYAADDEADRHDDDERDDLGREDIHICSEVLSSSDTVAVFRQGL